MASLAGLSAIVTSAGASIGRATALRLARDGAAVLLVGLDEGELRDVALAVAAEGGLAAWCVADATDEADVARSVDRARELPGRLAIAVSGVGRTTMAQILHYTAGEWRDEITTNIASAFLLLKHAGRAMRDSGGGSYVAISSHAAACTMRSLGAYCATKAGLEALMRGAADELGAHGIRVNVVRPGLTRREQSSPIFGSTVEDDYLVRTPLGRQGVPDDAAGVVAFLAGPDSSWMTGQCITIDGGLELRGAPDLTEAARRVRGDALFDTAARPSIVPPAADEHQRLAGATALVTGGGSSIGWAAAQLLARAGAHVTIAGRSVERLRSAALRAAADGFDIQWIPTVVTEDADVAAAVAAAAARTGRLDVCVAAAGSAVMAPLLECTVEQLLSPFELNVVGSYLTLKHAGRAMVAGGSFVAVSSQSAVVSFRGLAPYGASKAALDMLVRVAADELGPHGIRVNSVRPGLSEREAPSPIFSDQALLARYRERTPLTRNGTAFDSAYAIRYFAGPESAWVTGQCLTVDGGLELRGAPELTPMQARFNTIVEDRRS